MKKLFWGTLLFGSMTLAMGTQAWAGMTVVNCESFESCEPGTRCVTEALLQFNDSYQGAVTVFFNQFSEDGFPYHTTFPVNRAFTSDQGVTVFDSGQLYGMALGDNWLALLPTPQGDWIGVLTMEDSTFSQLKCQ